MKGQNFRKGETETLQGCSITEQEQRTEPGKE